MKMAGTETATSWETVDLPDFNSLPYIVSGVYVRSDHVIMSSDEF